MSPSPSLNIFSEADLVMFRGLDSLNRASNILYGNRENEWNGLIKKTRTLIRDQMVYRATKKRHSAEEPQFSHDPDSKPDISDLIRQFNNSWDCSAASIQHQRITYNWPIRVNIVVSDDALLNGSYAAFIDFRDITDGYRGKLELAKAYILQTNAFSVFAADAQHSWKSYRNPREPHTFWGVYLQPGEAKIDLSKLAEGDIDGAVESIDQVLAPVKKLTLKSPFPLAKNLVVDR